MAAVLLLWMLGVLPLLLLAAPPLLLLLLLAPLLLAGDVLSLSHCSCLSAHKCNCRVGDKVEGHC